MYVQKGNIVSQSITTKYFNTLTNKWAFFDDVDAAIIDTAISIMTPMDQAKLTMEEFFRFNAYKKVVTLDNSDGALRGGTVFLGTTPCLLKLMENINTSVGTLRPSIKDDGDSLKMINENNEIVDIETLEYDADSNKVTVKYY